MWEAKSESQNQTWRRARVGRLAPKAPKTPSEALETIYWRAVFATLKTINLRSGRRMTFMFHWRATSCLKWKQPLPAGLTANRYKKRLLFAKGVFFFFFFTTEWIKRNEDKQRFARKRRVRKMKSFITKLRQSVNWLIREKTGGGESSWEENMKATTA